MDKKHLNECIRKLLYPNDTNEDLSLQHFLYQQKMMNILINEVPKINKIYKRSHGSHGISTRFYGYNSCTTTSFQMY